MKTSAILWPALMTMVAAQLLDLATFLTMLRRVGIDGEANPLVAGVVQDGGLPIVVLAKLALVVFIGAVSVALLAMRGRTLHRAGWALLACTIAAGMLGGWTNALTIGVV